MTIFGTTTNNNIGELYIEIIEDLPLHLMFTDEEGNAEGQEEGEDNDCCNNSYFTNYSDDSSIDGDYENNQDDTVIFEFDIEKLIESRRTARQVARTRRSSSLMEPSSNNDLDDDSFKLARHRGIPLVEKSQRQTNESDQADHQQRLIDLSDDFDEDDDESIELPLNDCEGDEEVQDTPADWGDEYTYELKDRCDYYDVVVPIKNNNAATTTTSSQKVV